MSRSTPQEKRIRNKRKIRASISGTEARPRLSVFRSNTSFYAQLIDDVKAVTILSKNDAATKGTKMEGAIATGSELAKAALAKGIKAVVFDRNGFKYAGRVKAFADAARAGGLEF
jgi:large subunit ribosomal protein L18